MTDGCVNDGVERITLQTDGPEGANSAYVVPELGIVIDPGPPQDAAWESLRRGLRGAGVALEAVNHVVVTHWHVDHVGLAPRLADAANATVHMHECDAPLLAEYAAARERRGRRDVDALRTWGVPSDFIKEVRAADTPSSIPDETPVERHVDGDTVTGATLLHTPGHTQGHLALSVGDHLFVGDTLLPTYTPNVGGSDTRARNPLLAYLDSLARLEQYAGELHPGHGSALETPARFEAVRNHHHARTERVHEHVERRDAATPWDVAIDLFGEMRGIHVKFGAGEAAAHLAFLADEGDVAQVGDHPHRYRVRSSTDSD